MNRLSAPRYDFFKLLVATVLIILLFLMLLGGSAATPAATLPAENGSTPVPSESLASPFSPESTIAADPSPTLPAKSTATPDSAAATPTTKAMSATPSTPTEHSTFDESKGAPISGEGTACDTRLPSRLRVGQQARIAQRLNLRSDPTIDAPILQTNAVGTAVEIIGGPVCTPVGKRAYLWWQVRLVDGAEGWSAEIQLNEPAYLLQPIQ